MAPFSITKSTWGAPYTHVRQLFQAVIVPRTEYAAIIWHQPKYDGSTTGTIQIRKLITVQRLAMKAILGCYRTTPTAAMEVETGLQPPWIWLQTKILLATTRMQSLSMKHPIQEWLTSALQTRTACIPYRSNLENILQQFPTCAQGSRQLKRIFDPVVDTNCENQSRHNKRNCQRPGW